MNERLMYLKLYVIDRPLLALDRSVRAVRKAINLKVDRYDVIQTLHDEFNSEFDETECAKRLNAKRVQVSLYEEDQLVDSYETDALEVCIDYMLNFGAQERPDLDFSDAESRVVYELNADRSELNVRYYKIAKSE